MILVPRYKELGVKAIRSQVREVEDLVEYFPSLEENELPDRAYMWTVFSTKRTEVCKSLVENARAARNQITTQMNLLKFIQNFLKNYRRYQH